MGIRSWGCNLMNPSHEDKGKAKGENLDRHEKARQKEIIVKNENIDAISMKNSNQKEIK